MPARRPAHGSAALAARAVQGFRDPPGGNGHARGCRHRRAAISRTAACAQAGRGCRSRNPGSQPEADPRGVHADHACAVSRCGPGPRPKRIDYGRAVRRTHGAFLVEPFLHLDRQSGACRLCGQLRARRHPAARARPFLRHAAGRRAASGDADLSQPDRLDRTGQPGCAEGGTTRAWTAARPERESRTRDHGVAHAWRAVGLQPGRRHRIRPRVDRLDHRWPWTWP